MLSIVIKKKNILSNIEIKKTLELLSKYKNFLFLIINKADKTNKKSNTKLLIIVNKSMFGNAKNKDLGSVSNC